MSKSLWIKSLLVLVLVLGVGCSEDKLSDDLEPELTRVMDGVRFEYSQNYIPEDLPAEFKIYALFNDLTEEELSSSDLKGKINWSIETDDKIEHSQNSLTPNIVKFSGIGQITLKLEYFTESESFSASRNFDITVPVIASIAIEEDLKSSDLSACCPKIIDTKGNVVKGCVKRFKAVATYDNGYEEDQTSDTLEWGSTTGFAELIEVADMAGYPDTFSCVKDLLLPAKAGVFFAREIGSFAVTGSKLNITGTSSSITVKSPTVLNIAFNSSNPKEMVEDLERSFSVIGDLNNDTTADITNEVNWKTSDSTRAVFLSSGNLTSKNDSDTSPDTIVITAKHLTAGDITADVLILEKELVSVSIEPNSDDKINLIWNQLQQFKLRGFYNNDKNSLLDSDVSWEVDSAFAEIDAKGILTAGKVSGESATVTVTGTYKSKSATAEITVSSSYGDLIEFHAVPSTLDMIEGHPMPIIIKGYYSNETQQNLSPNEFGVTSDSLFDVSHDSNFFYITAKNVDENKSGNYTIDFGFGGMSTQLVVSNIFDTQVSSVEITKEKDVVMENTAVQLNIMGTLTGYESNDPLVDNSTVNWSCDSLCTVDSNGVVTISDIDTTSDSTTITAIVSNLDSANFPKQIKDVSADTTITIYNTPLVFFNTTNSAVEETNSTVTVTVNSSQTALNDIIIPFSIVDSSTDSTLGDDFTISKDPYQLVIAKGESSASFEINVINDNNVEPDENIVLMIGPNPVNANIGAQDRYTLKINANDHANVSFASASQHKTEGAGTVSIKIDLSAYHYEDVTVDYEAVAEPDCLDVGTRLAIADRDYLTEKLTGTATIKAGSLATWIQFDISDDGFHEVDECLALKLTGVEGEGNKVGIISPSVHTVTIKDNDTLQFNNSPNTDIYNTDLYTYEALTTPFDGSNDQWQYSLYNQPTWSDSTTDIDLQTFTLSGSPNKNQVGTQENDTFLCVYDADGETLSDAPGTQKICQSFKIEVRTCRLELSSGNINVPEAFLGSACGKPENHITIGEGMATETLTMVYDNSFEGILILNPDSIFQLSNATIANDASVDLNGGIIEVIGDNNSTIDGTINLTADATIDIAPNSQLTKFSNSLSVGNHKLTLLLKGNNSKYLGEPLLVDADNSILEVESSGVGNAIEAITITGDQNGTDGYVQFMGDVLTDTLKIEENAYLKIKTGTLTITSDTTLEDNRSLTLANNGTLKFTGDFSFDSTGSLSMFDSSILFPQSQMTISRDLNLTGNGTLDLRTTDLVLNADLNAAPVTVVTDINGTTLQLQYNASISADETLSFNEIAFDNYTLDLGSNIPGVDVSRDVVISQSFSGLKAENGQDLLFYGNLELNDGVFYSNGGTNQIKGQLLVSGGAFSAIDGTTDIYGGAISGGTFDVSGDVVRLYDDLNITTSGLIQSEKTSWEIKPDNTLSWNGVSSGAFSGSVQIDASADFLITGAPANPISGNVDLAGGSVTLKETSKLTGNLSISGSSEVNIETGETLDLDNSFPVAVGANTLKLTGGGLFKNTENNPVQINNTAGLLLLGDATYNTGSLYFLETTPAASPASLSLLNDYAITRFDISSDVALNLNSKILTIQDFVLPKGIDFIYAGSGTLKLNETVSIIGNLNNTSGEILDLKDATEITLDGTLDTVGGTLVTSGSKNNLVLQGDSNIFSDQDLTIKSISFNEHSFSKNKNLLVSANSLNLVGPGTISGGGLNTNTNAILNISDVTADGINYVIHDSNIFLSGNNNFINGTFDISNGSTVSTSGVFSFSPTSSPNLIATWDVSTDSSMSWNGTGNLDGTLNLNADSEFITHTATANVSANLVVNGDATIDIDSGDLNYTGSPILLAHQLTMEGGSFVNSEEKQIIVKDNGSLVLVSGSGSINFVTLNSDTSGDIQLNTKSDFLIGKLSLNQNSKINIAGGQILTINEKLKIPENTKLTVVGTGRLILNGGLELASGAEFLISEAATLQVNGDVQVPGDATFDIAKARLDLSNKTLSLADNWTINCDTLISDISTDIQIGTNVLTWISNNQDLHGSITIGDGSADNDGRFTIEGTGASVTANIYLKGGTLDIDVTTNISGQIYHLASSTIDVDKSATLNYTVFPLQIDEFILSLKGGGIFNNTNPVVLNQIQSVLKIATDGGELENLSVVDFSGDIRVQQNKSYTISTLSLNNSLTVDTSDDSLLIVTNSISIPASHQIQVLGSGVVEFPPMTIPGSSSFNQSEQVKVSTQAVTLGGEFNSQGDSLTLKGDVSGDGLFNVKNTSIFINDNSDLMLTNADDLSSDINTKWYISGSIFKWNGSGGTLNGGIVDVSPDGTFQLSHNPADISAKLDLKGILDIDVTTDLQGSLLVGAAPTISFENNALLNLHNNLEIPDSSTLTVSGLGLFEMQALDIAESGNLKVTNTDLVLNDDLSIGSGGKVTLINVSLSLDSTADLLTGSGTLTLQSARIITYQDVTVDIGNISADSSSDWGIENSSTLTWNTSQSLTGDLITIGAGSSLHVIPEIIIDAKILMLNDSSLTVDATSDLNKDLNMQGSTEIQITDTASLVYKGSQIDLSGNTLEFSGSGVFTNKESSTPKWVALTGSGSTLHLSGAGGEISAVKSANSAENSLIKVDDSYLIEDLLVESDVTIDIEDGMILTIDDSLDIQNGAELTLTGLGTLYVKNGFSVGGIVTINKGILLVGQTVVIEDTGKIVVDGGTFKQPDGESLKIEGTGDFDLRNQDYILVGDLTLSSKLITDTSTDIYTKNYTLEWISDGSSPLQGAVHVGDASTDGVFRIKDQSADVSADIYLWGGVLDIDVYTNLSGTIYHMDSSTIDITGDVSLYYTGNDVSVDAFTLTLAGDGKFENKNDIVLNELLSKLQLTSSGWLEKAVSDSTADIRVPTGGDYTISNLIINQSLTFDVSQDAELTIEQPFTLPNQKTFEVNGSGTLQLAGLSLDSTCDIAPTINLKLGGNVDVSADGVFLFEHVKVLVDSSTDTIISGSGTLNAANSDVSLNSDLTLSLESDGILNDNPSTSWWVKDKNLTWSGYGGDFSGSVDVSNDGVFHLIDNPAKIEGNLKLEGRLKADVTTDISGAITIIGVNSIFDVSNDARLTIHSPLNISEDTSLRIEGNGVTDLLEALTIIGSGKLSVENTYLTLNNRPNITGTLNLNQTTLYFDASADTLGVDSKLDFTESEIVLNTDLTISSHDVSVDSNTDWRISDGSSLTWSTTQELAGNQISLGQGSALFVNDGNIPASITLLNSKLKIIPSADITGNLSFDGSNDSTADIDIQSGSTLNYQGEIFEFSGNHLVLSGGGHIVNELSGDPKWFLLNGDQPALALTGSGGEISNVKVNAMGESLIQTEKTYTIDHLVVASNLEIYIEDEQKLIIDASLDIPPGVEFTLTGLGTLQLNHDLTINGEITVRDGGTIQVAGDLVINDGEVVMNSGLLDFEGELEINGTGKLDARGGNIAFPPNSVVDGDTGTLDLRDVDLQLTGNLTLSTNLITDSSTDIYTDEYTLEWQSDGTDKLNGAIYIDEPGTFRTSGTKADISADIYLRGGTLDVDIITNLSGNIYHEKSSTIDILNPYTLNYTGKDVSVDAWILSLAGDGSMVNEGAIIFNNPDSKLFFTNNGSLKKASAEVGPTSEIKIGGNNTINQLVMTQPLTIDVSQDSKLSVTEPINIAFPAAFYATGEGSLELEAIKLDSTCDISSAQGLILKGNVDVSGDGLFKATGIALELSHATGVSFNGDGDINIDNSAIHVNSNLLLNLEAGQLSNNSTRWLVDGHTLSWNGKGGNLKGSIDLSSDATLAIQGNPDTTIEAKIDLFEGHLDIDTTTDIEGTFTTHSTYDASMDVAAGVTLSLLNQDLLINSENFAISGAGKVEMDKLIIEGATQVIDTTLNLNDNLQVDGTLNMPSGKLILDGAVTSISGAGSIDLDDVSVDIKENLDITISSLNSTLSTLWNFNGNTVSWDNSSDIKGTNLELGDSGQLLVNQEIDISSPLNISGGLLGIYQEVNVSGDIAKLDGNATIDVSSDFYLNYTGNELDIDAYTLNLSGSGVIDNTNDIDLNNSNSVLHLTGPDGMLHKAKFSADSSPDYGIKVDEDYVIQQLTLDDAKGRIKVSPNKTLIIGDQLIATGTNSELIKDPTDEGTIILHEIILDGSLELGEGFTLAPDATLYVKSNSTLTVNSDLFFNDGLIVVDGAKLIIAGGEYTVTFAGGYTLEGSGEVEVSGNVTMDIVSSNVDSGDWNDTTTSSGSTSPSKDSEKDVISFNARTGHATIHLSWSFQTGFENVLIHRSEVGYPNTTSDGFEVYDGSDLSMDDDNTSGVRNGVTYYYTAFAHDGLGNYAPGVHAMAAATMITDGLISYYMLGEEDITAGRVLDSSGYGNHGSMLTSLDATGDRLAYENQALHFNGSDDAIEIDNPFIEVASVDSNNVSNDFTITFWLKTSLTAGDASADWFFENNFPLVDGKIGVGQPDFGIALGAGKIIFGLEDANSTYNLASASVVNDNAWHHVAITREFSVPATMTIFIDGQPDASQNINTSINLTASSLLSIGRSPYGDKYFMGDLDDIRFYGKILSSTEIQTLYSYSINRLIPDTGQTSSMRTGDDGTYKINTPKYTIIDDNPSQVMIFDNVTGLTWQWDDSSSNFIHSSAKNQCNNLTFGGHSDWRLPTIWELINLADYGSSSDAIPAGFTGSASGVWSITQKTDDTDNAWALRFDNGIPLFSETDQNYRVRCVRGHSMPGYSFLPTSSLITDHLSGLIWKTQTVKNNSWNNAIDGCSADWRLPNIKELFSIVDFTSKESELSFSEFDNTEVLEDYWSSTYNASSITYRRWSINFGSGFMNSTWYSSSMNFRCVSGGINEQ